MRNSILQHQNDCTIHGHGQPEPIGLEYIASSLVSNGFLCHFHNNFELVVSSAGSPTRLCLFSALSHELPKVIEAAQRAKVRGEATVLGGYHVSGHLDNLTDGPFDYLVVGEGENVAPAIAKAHICGDQNDLDEFQSRTAGAVCLVQAPRIAHLDALPHPLRIEGRLTQYRIYDLMWPPASCQKNTALVLGSRGCANDCDFCASSTVWGRGIRERSSERIVEELRNLADRFETNTIVFIDQSLGQDKQWTLDLCKTIKSANLGLNWYHQSNLTIDRNVIRAMAEAGCSKIGFGLEGISPRAVSMIKPLNPCDLEVINSLFEYCNVLGLFVKVYLMIGFPWETDEIVAEYFEWLPKIRANQVKISYFTPFPGTQDWMRYRDQLVTHNWTDFDTVKMPVVYNKRISITQYNKIRTMLFKSFYGSHTYADVTHQMIFTYPHYIESYREFADYLDRFKIISGDEAWLERVRHGQASRFIMTGRH